MSQTKKNFDEYFEARTVADSEFVEQRENQRSQFAKLPAFIIDLNDLRGVHLTADIINPHQFMTSSKALIKGKYRGLILTEENKTIKTIWSLIEFHGFTLLKTNFVEDDDNFTFINFTIK